MHVNAGVLNRNTGRATIKKRNELGLFHGRGHFHGQGHIFKINEGVKQELRKKKYYKLLWVCPQFLRRKNFSGQIAAINYARKGGNWGRLDICIFDYILFTNIYY
jgi:hypothetical protein